MGTYRLSAAGRRLNLALLFGALLIWFFAFWSFSSTLGIQYSPAEFRPSVQAVFTAGLGVGRVVPALLMLALLIATPLLIWSLLVEGTAQYTLDGDGVRFTALGMTLHCPWRAIAALHAVDEDRDEPLDVVICTVDPTEQIANPILRALQRGVVGRNRLPIYAGLEAREQLITTIRDRAGLPAPAAAYPAAESAG